jgi:hypothetical protein
MVSMSRKSNWSLDADTQRHEAASPQALRAGHLQR